MSEYLPLCTVAETLHLFTLQVETRRTQRAQTSLTEADHYSHMNPYLVKEVLNVERLW